MQFPAYLKVKCRKQSYFVQLTLCFETLIDHSFTTASSQGPGRTNKEPDEGGCTVQPLRQTEEMRRLQSVHFCTALIRDGHCTTRVQNRLQFVHDRVLAAKREQHNPRKRLNSIKLYKSWSWQKERKKKSLTTIRS